MTDIPAAPIPDDSPDTATPSGLDTAFLALLCCPLCDNRPFLRLDSDGKTLHCDTGNHTFPITDGFPDLRPPGETIALPG